MASFSRTTWVSRQKKGHELDHLQIICTLLQTANHASTSSLIFTVWMLFLTPNQECQSTEGKFCQHDFLEYLKKCLLIVAL